jgi:hypothetical protein
MGKKKPKKKKVMFYAKKGKIARTDYDDGSRSVTMTPELEEVFEEQRKAFAEKFGREPGPDDPLFFDPDADTPQLITGETRQRVIKGMAEAMRKAGIDGAYIYAYIKTGLLVTQENMHLMKPEELEEFDETVKEYERLKGIVD